MTLDTIHSLGFVEVRGLAAAIETADSMLKCAEVRLLRQLLREPMLITITVEGELGACQSAVDAGQASAKRMGAYVSSTVMGRPANDTADFVLKLAEAGSQPFGGKPPLAFEPRSAFASLAPETETAEEQDTYAKLLKALSGLPGGYGLQRLVRAVGGDSASVRKHLDDLCDKGLLVKRRGRYLLAEFSGGGNERNQ